MQVVHKRFCHPYFSRPSPMGWSYGRAECALKSRIWVKGDGGQLQRWVADGEDEEVPNFQLGMALVPAKSMKEIIWLSVGAGITTTGPCIRPASLAVEGGGPCF